MSDQPETYQRISVPEAAEQLGVSVATVRRRIRDGSLRAERVQRPQGVAYVVLLGSDHGTDHDRSDSDQQVGTTARLNQSAQPAPAEAIAAMIQATLTPIIAPLVGELAASRQVNERLTDQLMSQADTIAELREERGRLSTALAAEREKSSLEAWTAAQVLQEPSTPLRRLWARWWPILAGLVALVAAVVLLAWPR